ncbi:membrane protein [Streptomyces spiralis]|uniref:Membrane protein n=1 Tax=Streptomyces spiralis TaxID=66376 RepID=A0A918ZG21_9ACTN|nr:zf-HC2 domain-containing protein [Streptomyces spiralis]GHE51460.1 membrane protein [Streptomyces spiralis]
MSGSRTDPAASGLAEQHLGDRLSALVDGELGHDTRERVLAHVATCPKCKAEVDAQRRLKNVFAETAPPPPSESFLARLQGLPAGGDGDGGSPLAAGGFPGLTGRSGGPGGSGVFGVRRGEPFEFRYVPVGPHPSALDEPEQQGGFRIHPVGRSDGERSASRGLRFAFVAAGAVSLAAVALGGVTTGAAGDLTAEARGGSGAGTNVTPARTGGGGAVTGSESARRRQSSVPLLAQAQRSSSGAAPVVPTSLSAPLLPGAPTAATGPAQNAARPPVTPVAAGAAAISPLIRPLGTPPPISLTAWSPDSQLRAPGLLAAPVPGPSSASPTFPAPHRAN